ncbi:CBS domain-containing protein, partial [candidate division KSB1 bacterium]|nr:CBS domain-containing protein [candidate division KSB1 bacterium]
IIVHELAHSLVARRFGMPIKGITLFIFGGVAEMNEEPPSAKSEFFMAVAGPLTSILIGMVFYAFGMLAGASIPEAVAAVIRYLALINLILAGFNLLPAFPLDGGRVFRSILWAWKKDLKWATRFSSRIGSGFGVLLIVLGGLSFFGGNIVGGIWWVLIGFFMLSASRMSYQQLLLRKALEGEPVQRFMREDPVTVPPDITLQELIENYVYKYHYKMFPVVENDKLVGCISTAEVKEYSKDEWQNHQVGELAANCSDDNTIDPQEDALNALSTMRRTDKSRLMVVEKSELVGVITLKDMLKFFSLKLELNDGK